MTRFSAHPLWLVGFRPFFILASLSGLGLPLVWAAVVLGDLPAPPASVSTLQWHAHEMLFGFGWALLAGFLLTASKNWVKIRGYHGGALVFLAAAWLFERAGMWFGGYWPAILFQVSSQLFLVSIVVMIVSTLVRHRRSDSYPDNLFFIVMLPVFPVAKVLLLSPDTFALGWGMAVGLFRLAFLLMLERTLTQFMQGVFKVELRRNRSLDAAVKLLAAAMVFADFLPGVAATGIALTLAALLAARFVLWKPQLAVRRLDIGIMYLGYLMIVVQLLFAYAGAMAPVAWVGALAVHVFGFGVMGFIIPAMLIRISKGHTGRKVVFDTIDKLVLWVMILAFAFRVVAPQLHPAGYPYWIYLAAACWSGGFAIIAWRYIPFLLQPRVDGKEH